MKTRKEDIIEIILENGKGDYYNAMMDRHEYKQLDTKEKENAFINDISILIKEDMDIDDKLTILSYMIYHVNMD